MHSSSAYILVFHGSHDPRSQRAAKQLTGYFRQAIQQAPCVAEAVGEVLDWRTPPVMANRSVVTEVALIPVQDVYLECVAQPLPEQIQQFIEQFIEQPNAQADGSIITEWRVIPVFLLAGMHVMEDLPAAIAAVQSAVPLTLLPHLGSHAGLRRLLNERMSVLPMEAWVLVAHGSRRAGANHRIETLAEHLGVVTAYWSTPPTLEQRLQELADSGLRRIGILPYFLFSGGITDAIAQTVSQLSQQCPQLSLNLVHPLDVNLPELADLLVDLAVGTRI
ncbi:MAG: sirohydrochlorin chelatase [Leptolyngbyaceae cyanobacterium bins.349]|nr:sirohydrochlorin chelatase [Leptolyngbyaceae cyanobacterium bins.349]